jgi:hypothetical protein
MILGLLPFAKRSQTVIASVHILIYTSIKKCCILDVSFRVIGRHGNFHQT